jgi:Phage integrase SAM-like domain
VREQTGVDMAYIGAFRDGWRAQIQRNGQRLTKTFRTKREAQAWATEQEAKKTPLRANTLRQAIDRYLETVSTQKRNAVDWERRRFDALAEYLGENTPLSDIDSDKLGQWRDWRLQTVSGSTVMREVNLFRNLFSIARREWKWISASPFEGVRLPKENSPRDAKWGWREIRRMLREGERRGGKTLEVTQAFHVALRTALRLQEALAAPEGFDAKRKIVTIPPSKTNPKPESIPLTRQAVRLLGSLKPFTVGPNEASVLFSELCRELLIQGLQFRDSRATALTLMSRKMDVLTLARVSRHRNLELLRAVYYRATAEEISRRL